MPSPDFRAAHAWLRGYSDALAGNVEHVGADAWPDHLEDYLAGFVLGVYGDEL